MDRTMTEDKKKKKKKKLVSTKVVYLQVHNVVLKPTKFCPTEITALKKERERQKGKENIKTVKRLEAKRGKRDKLNLLFFFPFFLSLWVHSA